MPITAKLSQQFYERLGEQAATELVEWMNQVDLASRTELRSLNDLNHERFRAEMNARFAVFETRFAEFEARMELRFAEFQTKMERRFAEFETKMERRFSEFETKMERRFSEFETKMERRFAAMEIRIERGFREQTRFLYVALAAQLALILGLYLR